MREHQWKMVSFTSSFNLSCSRWALIEKYHREELFLHKWVTQVWKRLRAVMKTAVVDLLRKGICRMTKKEKEATAFTVMIYYLDYFRIMKCLRKVVQAGLKGRSCQSFYSQQTGLSKMSDKCDKTNPTSLQGRYVHPGTRP